MDEVKEIQARIERIERQIGVLPLPWESKPVVKKAAKKK